MKNVIIDEIGEDANHLPLSQAYIKGKIEPSVKEYLIPHMKTRSVLCLPCVIFPFLFLPGMR